MMKNKARYYFIIFYFIISIFLILVVNNYQISDALTYHNLASEVVEMGEFYPHSHNLQDTYIRPSLYINIIAIFYFVFGTNPLIIKIFNVLLVLIQFFCIDHIINIIDVKCKNKSKYWYFLFFLYPNIYFMNLLTLTEPLFLTLLMLSFLMFIRIIKQYKDHIINYILSGSFIALAILTRPVALLIPMFMVLFLIIKKHRAIKVVLYFLTLVIIIFSYGFLQKHKIGKINSWGTTSGINLFREYNPHGTGRRSQKSLEYIFSFDISSLDAFEKNKFYTEKAIKWIKHNTGKAIIITLKKPIYMFMYDGVQIEEAFNKKNEIDNFTIKAIISKFTKGFVSWIILINQIIYSILIILILRGIYNLLINKKYEKLILLLTIPFLLFMITLSASGNNRFHFVIIISSYPLIYYGLYRTKKKYD